MKYKHSAMGSIFSKILAMAASEPAAAAPMLEFQGDVTCCNCESSSDEESPRPKGLDAYR